MNGSVARELPVASALLIRRELAQLRTLRSHQQLIFDYALKARLKVACGDRLPKGLNRFLLQVARVEVHEQTSLLNAGGR
jgi:hypothetical protein